MQAIALVTKTLSYAATVHYGAHRASRRAGSKAAEPNDSPNVALAAPRWDC